jgi:peroxiredoxin family protein
MQSRKNIIIYTVIAVAMAVAAYLFLTQNKNATIKKDDREKFASTVEHFNILEEMALDAMRLRDTTTQETFLQNLKETALTDWADCVNVLELAEKMDLPPHIENYRNHLVEYSNHRLQQTLFLIRAAEEKTEKYRESIDSVQKKINAVKEIIKKEKPLFN